MPYSGFGGARDVGDPDIKGGSGCKQWWSLNSKEKTEKSDDEEVHEGGEMMHDALWKDSEGYGI